MTSLAHPVILCGGSGKRLWPLSRPKTPKQFLPLISEKTLFQETLLRLKPEAAEKSVELVDPIVIANREHADLVEEQLGQIGVSAAAILLEPVGRNTAPAAAAAALVVRRAEPEGVVILLPADHFIADAKGFRARLVDAVAAAEAGHIVTFGITPTRPDTGYGYIEPGAQISDLAGTYRVARFVEKPALELADEYFKGGRFVWNSGMFAFRADVMLEEMRRHCPAILDAVAKALPSGAATGRIAIDPTHFTEAPSEPIDIAVMERTDRAAMVPASIGWSDVGSFEALWSAAKRDTDDNLIRGDVIQHRTTGSYLRAESRLVAALGLEDIVVVETSDSVLVAKRNAGQELKTLVDELERQGRYASQPDQDGSSGLIPIEIAPDSRQNLVLKQNQIGYLIVTEGKIEISAVLKKTAERREVIMLGAGWSGEIAARDGSLARCLLVTLTEF